MNIEHLPFPMVILDADRRIEAITESAATLLGVEPKELVGLNVSVALRPRTQTGKDLLVGGWDRAALLPGTRRFVEQEIILRRADDTEIEVVIEGGYNRDESRRLTGASVILRPRYRGPRRPRSGVRIVSAVSHELRSPLTSVRGYTSLLLKQWETIADDDRKMMLTQIDRDARRISRMIGELLDIARIESGRVQLNRVEIDLEAMAREVVEKTKTVYPALEAEVSFPDGFPQVWADPDKIEQVLINLVENACKYASPKGVQIEGCLDGPNVVVSVSDTGPGIPAADLPNLFQQFFRSSEGRPTGTGLGLWISRGLIEAHKGELTAESDETNGSAFRFTLPQRAFEDMHPLDRRAT